MKLSLRLLLLTCSLTLIFGGRAQAGQATAPAPPSTVLAVDEFEPPRFEFASETAYLLGFIGNPNSYEIGAQFFTARWRWGVNRDDHSIFRGYNQVYLLGMVEPIFRGPENHYFGLSTGFRHVFVRPGWRLQPYASGGVGLGFIDSTDEFRQGQGQDFTFNILTAVGFDYLVNEHWKVNVGALYQHLSNAGQTDPNPSLNLIGPQIGATYSF
ncbi:MAG TPA: acyloxyacyl hydrolase [Chthoniobacterales bacterium]|nr:acyloxyacyl hydrolase [Chthoniobacterales bacterium]